MSHTADIHAAITLGAAPAAVTTAITAPPSPRALSVTGNAAGITGDVTLVGTDYSGAALTEVIALSGADTVFGREAFATVTSIGVPAQTNSGTDTVSVGVADRLYSIPTARAFADSGIQPLADAGTYPDSALTATETVVRARLEAACRCALLPSYVAEALDGTHSNILRLAFSNPTHESPRRPLTVTAASIDGVALTATELAAVKAHGDGRLVRTDGAGWSSSTGYQDLAVEVTYYHGWSVADELAVRAALLYTVRILAQGELPIGATDYDTGGRAARFPYPGVRPHWTGDDEVDSLIAELEEHRVVIA